MTLHSRKFTKSQKIKIEEALNDSRNKNETIREGARRAELPKYTFHRPVFEPTKYTSGSRQPRLCHEEEEVLKKLLIYENISTERIANLNGVFITADLDALGRIKSKHIV